MIKDKRIEHLGPNEVLKENDIVLDDSVKSGEYKV